MFVARSERVFLQDSLLVQGPCPGAEGHPRSLLLLLVFPLGSLVPASQELYLAERGCVRVCL